MMNRQKHSAAFGNGFDSKVKIDLIFGRIAIILTRRELNPYVAFSAQFNCNYKSINIILRTIVDPQIEEYTLNN